MTPVAESVFTELRAHRLVAVIRAASDAHALEAARAVVRGGIRLVEITFTCPDAPAILRALADADAVVGAGTVLTAEQARAAIADLAFR